MNFIAQSSLKEIETPDYDLIICGAGLAGLSLAYAFKKKQPLLKMLVLDSLPHGTNDRTWSFHEKDINDLNFWNPLIDFEWSAYDVYFSYQRELKGKYFTIQSHSFFKKMESLLGSSLQWSTGVLEAYKNHVITENGLKYTASIVVDTRPKHHVTLENLKTQNWGFQKFVGLEVILENPHGLTKPIIMDATLEQIDGYRFFYVLPYGPNHVLVEETFYSNSFHLDDDLCLNRINNYIDQHHWKIKTILRQEKGILSIPTNSDSDEQEKIYANINEPFFIGTRAGLYHPVTGYSLLWAFKTAEKLSSISEFNSLSFKKALLEIYKEFKKTEPFYLLLNRLLFWGATTKNRKTIFQKFYKLPKNTVERFYAGQSNLMDKLRILSGKPPIPLIDGLKVFLSMNHKPTLKKESSI